MGISGTANWRSFLKHHTQAVARLWGRCRDVLRSDGYRPEQHYMRGPGPKSAKRPSAANDQTG
jgi:hypothetical protein